jgi:hypothetical protein
MPAGERTYPTAIKLDNLPENVYDFTTYKLMVMMEDYAARKQRTAANEAYKMLLSYENKETCIIWAKGMPVAYQIDAPEGFKRELLEKVSEMLDYE